MNIAQYTAVPNQVNTGNQQAQQAVQQYGYFYAYRADQDAKQEIFQDASLERYRAQAVGDVTTEIVVAAAPAAAAPAAAAALATALPATGGISLLGRSARALLARGGLVVRRFVR